MKSVFEHSALFESKKNYSKTFRHHLMGSVGMVALICLVQQEAEARSKIVPSQPSVEIHFEALEILRQSVYEKPITYPPATPGQWQVGPQGKIIKEELGYPPTSQPAPIPTPAPIITPEPVAIPTPPKQKTVKETKPVPEKPVVPPKPKIKKSEPKPVKQPIIPPIQEKPIVKSPIIPEANLSLEDLPPLVPELSKKEEKEIAPIPSPPLIPEIGSEIKQPTIDPASKLPETDKLPSLFDKEEDFKEFPPIIPMKEPEEIKEPAPQEPFIPPLPSNLPTPETKAFPSQKAETKLELPEKSLELPDVEPPSISLPSESPSPNADIPQLPVIPPSSQGTLPNTDIPQPPSIPIIDSKPTTKPPVLPPVPPKVKTDTKEEDSWFSGIKEGVMGVFSNKEEKPKRPSELKAPPAPEPIAPPPLPGNVENIPPVPNNPGDAPSLSEQLPPTSTPLPPLPGTIMETKEPSLPTMPALPPLSESLPTPEKTPKLPSLDAVTDQKQNENEALEFLQQKRNDNSFPNIEEIMSPPPLLQNDTTSKTETIIPKKQQEKTKYVEPQKAPISKGRALEIMFSRSETEVPLSAQKGLKTLTKKLTDNPNLTVSVVAYAHGSEDQASIARRVSLSRALNIRAFLIDLGIDNLRINVQAMGNKNEGGNPERVDIFVK